MKFKFIDTWLDAKQKKEIKKLIETEKEMSGGSPVYICKWGAFTVSAEWKDKNIYEVSVY